MYYRLSFLCLARLHCSSILFLFTDTATTEIYTLSLHDALPIYTSHWWRSSQGVRSVLDEAFAYAYARLFFQDRKSTRLNSSHLGISYAVFCLKKKKKLQQA